MVFEQLFKEKWLEKKPIYAFILGFIYAVIGIISARLIFSASIGLMSVAFTSILLIPSLNRLLSYEENVEIREKKFHLIQLFKDHKDIFAIYFFMFLGVFIVYSFTALMFPEILILKLFAPQLKVAGIAGQASGGNMFLSILGNNIIILIVCLLLSLIYGAGSILFITWNASVWGAIFGVMARQSVGFIGKHPIVFFASMMLPILPHMITEAVSYFSAAIAGGVVSKAVLREKWRSKKFHHVLTDGVLLVVLGFVLIVIAAWLEVYIFPMIR